MIEAKLRAELTETRSTNNPFYGKVNAIKVTEDTLITEYDKREDIASVGVYAKFMIKDGNQLIVEVNRHYFDSLDEGSYQATFTIDDKTYELYIVIDGKQIINILLSEWLNYGEFEDGEDADNEYKPVSYEVLES